MSTKIFSLKRRVLYFFLGFLLIFVLFVGCQADFIARQFLLHPTKLDPHWKPNVPGCEEVFFETADKFTLHGLYFPYKPTETAPRGGVILFSHGNGGTVADWGNIGILLREKLDASVFVYDYRGYGKSEGTSTASSILADGRAARKWLAQRESVAESEIIQMGRSLGGAVAIDLAAKDGAKAVIVESTFTSLPDMAGQLVPGVPSRYLLREQLRSEKKIEKYDGPLFLSHGTADTLIPFEQGKRLYEAASSEKKVLYPVQGGDHNTFPPAEYYDKLREFLGTINSQSAADTPR